MKKICFMLVCLLLISNTPSFAMKIIVNETDSRIVPSRSTTHYDSDLDAVYHAEKGKILLEEVPSTKNPEQPIRYVRKYLTNEEIYNLSRDFREELIGTYWNYAELEGKEKTITEEPINEEIANTDDFSFKKRGSREAADYYMIDSIKDPDNAVPSGFPQ